MDNTYEAMKKKLEEKTGDSTFFSSILSSEQIPVEALAALGSNVTLEEFLAEMKKHDLEVFVTPKGKQQETEPHDEAALSGVHLALAVEDTPEGRERYLQMREKAQQRLGETGYIQSLLETESGIHQAVIDEQALKELNTASYQGDFGELRDLSKNLKKEGEHHED
ncbi:MAG: hypothetical protein K2P22_03370 [Lachnospiraceae bacterium]|nr:hypothetical protein [Lachnospiraceae bacterium]